MSLVLPHLTRRRWLKRADGRAGTCPITVFDSAAETNLIAGREVTGLVEHLQLISELQNDGISWKQRMRQIELSAPTNVFGGLAGLEGNSPVHPAALTAVTFVVGDFSPFNGVTFCPVPNRSTHLDFWSSYSVALAATPGTLLVTPGVGTALSAKNLGPGVATATLGTSGTGVLLIDGLLTARTISIPGGSQASWYFSGNMLGKLATAGTGTSDVNQLIGFTATTGDSTAANGLWMTMTGTAATASISTQQIRFGSWS
jgi:hypothetical protein